MRNQLQAAEKEIVSLHEIINGTAGTDEYQGKRIDDIGVDNSARQSNEEDKDICHETSRWANEAHNQTQIYCLAFELGRGNL